MVVALYRIAIGLYHFGIRIAARFNAKAQAWVKGRENWLSDLVMWRSTVAEDEQLIWMHCASLGEFEQGRPVLERLRQAFPTCKIVLSFYSPSGYEQRRNYAHADYVCYLPPDGATNAQRWIGGLKPDLVIFVKYEFWYYHLQAAFQKGIPTFLIAAVFRPDQLFFRWYGRFFKHLLSSFSHIYVQTDEDKTLLTQHGINAVTVAGDPRVDQVLSIAAERVDFPLVAAFKGKHPLFIAGSTWPPGEDLLLADQELWQHNWKLMIAPHDISEGHIQRIIKQCKVPWLRYSTRPSEQDLSNARILILDTIGMLSKVYRYGDLAYIGGGFGRSIHNTLEPAAHGLPVLFGPQHEKFSEAISMRKRGGAFSIEDKAEFKVVFSRLSQTQEREVARQEISAYLQLSRGAATQIATDIGAVMRPK